MGLYCEDFTDALRIVTRGRTLGEGDTVQAVVTAIDRAPLRKPARRELVNTGLLMLPKRRMTEHP